MKKFLAIILLLMAALPYGMSAQTGFTTAFDISGLPDTISAVARIHDSPKGFDDWRFDTIQIVNGRGVLNNVSRSDYPTIMYVFTPNGTITAYTANNEHELIEGSADDLAGSSLRYSGAPWSDDIMLYNETIASRRDAYNKAMSNFKSLTKEQRDSLAKESARIDSLEQRFFTDNPNSWLTMQKMTFRMMDMPRGDVSAIYSALHPDRRESGYGKLIGRYLAIKPIEPGDALSDYDIEATDRDGCPFRLSDVGEPYIILEFSQLYCGACILATKDIKQLKDKYEGKIAFINYSCDDTKEDWNMAIERDKPTWLSVFDGSGASGTTSLKYNVNSYPTFFIFGPDRTLLHSWSGYGPGLLENKIARYIPMP